MLEAIFVSLVIVVSTTVVSWVIEMVFFTPGKGDQSMGKYVIFKQEDSGSLTRLGSCEGLRFLCSMLESFEKFESNLCVFNSETNTMENWKGQD